MKFQHVTADLFDGEHPNARHIVGAVYDPIARTATVCYNYAAPEEGDPVAKEGQYLVFTPGAVKYGSPPTYPRWHVSDMHPGTPNVCLISQVEWDLLTERETQAIKAKADIIATTQAGCLTVRSFKLHNPLVGLSCLASERTDTNRFDYAALLASLTATHTAEWEAIHGEGL